MASPCSLAYPLRTNSNGGLEVATGYEIIQDLIRSVVDTRPNEMPMASLYGTVDPAFTAFFSPGVVAQRIRQALTVQLPTLSTVVQSGSTAEQAEGGHIQIQITWQDTRTGLSGSLDFEVNQ